MDKTGNFENDINLLIQNAARLFAQEGDAKLVSILVFSKITTAQTGYDNWDGGKYIFSIYIDIPHRIYLEIKSELDNISQKIHEKLQSFMHLYKDTWIGDIFISPQLIDLPDWQQKAIDWLSGSGVTNQGRVRSNNIASREVDGLLFRSMPEIHLYSALKSKGVAFAPLAVFIKGGNQYSRIEPDFIAIKNGIILCIEIDGDTVHTETPAEANARTRILSNEGVIVERFSASRCETPEKANVLANEILNLFERHRSNRR